MKISQDISTTASFYHIHLFYLWWGLPRTTTQVVHAHKCLAKDEGSSSLAQALLSKSGIVKFLSQFTHQPAPNWSVRSLGVENILSHLSDMVPGNMPVRRLSGRIHRTEFQSPSTDRKSWHTPSCLTFFIQLHKKRLTLRVYTLSSIYHNT